jgi:hypothetical protein
VAYNQGVIERKRAGVRLPSAGVALFFLLLGCYLLTMSGHTYSSDEETVLAAGERVLTTGSFAIPRGDLMNRAPGVDQQSYSRYGPGQSVLAIPFILAGKGVALLAPDYERFLVRLFALMLPALATAATGVILYAWARQIGYSTRVALVTGLLFGFTSYAWPHGRTFFTEPLSMFFLALCAYGFCKEERHWWMIAGAAAALALAAKFSNLLALPLIALYAIAVSRRVAYRSSLQALAERIVFSVLGAAAPLGLLFYYNTRLFGGPLNSGYGGINLREWLSMSEEDGLYGLTLSPGKGILFFSPTILLGLIGMGFYVRRQWRESLLGFAMLAAHIAFYSRIDYWHGDGSWGPRYLAFTMPFVYLPAAGLLAALAAWRNRLMTGLVALLTAASFTVQLMPLLVNFDTYIFLTNGHQRFFYPSVSPIVGHPRLWFERMSAWWASNVSPPPNTAILRDGFSFSEGDRSKGELLPRWSRANGQIVLYPASNGPIDGRIVVGDHRPWPLPHANFVLLLDGKPLEGVQRIDVTGENIVWELTFQLTPEQARGGATLTLQSDTWNPTVATQDNPRNEDLGLRVDTLELRQGAQSLRLVEALPVPPPGNGRRAIWLWYQDTPNTHLFDIWLWYLAVSGMPLPAMRFVLALIGLPALLLFVIGFVSVITRLRNPPTAQQPVPAAPLPRVAAPIGAKEP